MNKNAIKKFAIEARKKLIASVSDRAGMLGITAEGCSEPISKGLDFEVYKTVAGTEVTLGRTQCEQRRKLKEQIEARGFETVVEEVAYTWFNRICAIRFMEVNDYLPTRVRVLSSEKEGKNEPDIVTQAPDVDLDFTDKEREYILDCKINNKLDELFKMLFIKQCNKLSEILPELFEATEDYTEMLLNISYTNKDDIINMLVNQETGIPEADFNVSTIGEDGQPTGQVEIIGWLYQYYNTELKDDTFAQLKKNVKISKERIPAATQLFTPDWIVRYMVENSVGRLWIEHLRAVDSTVNEKEVAERFGWKYYLPEAEQEADVNIKLAEIRSSYKDLMPEDITCIDPCMGSGHILVAMFDVLMDIYKSAGYSERDAALEIVEHNIHGLDIDKRAYQLAYFAVMMKGRGYNRRFFRGKDDAVPRAKVYAIHDSNDVLREHLKYFGSKLDDDEKREAINQISRLLDAFVNASELGSLLDIEAFDWELLEKFVSDVAEIGQLSFETVGIDETKEKLRRLCNLAYVLSTRYAVVVTNPPYMGVSNASSKLIDYVKKNYPDSKTDLFAVFIEKCGKMVVKNGYQAMITQHAWMFLSSYETLRKKLKLKTLYNMLHLGARAFEEIGGEVVQTTSFVYRNVEIDNCKGIYCRLVNESSQKTKENAFLERKNLFSTSSILFNNIPGAPIAYWLSDLFVSNFDMPSIEDSYIPKFGMSTGNGELYIRMWHEVNLEDIDKTSRNEQEAIEKNKKWVALDKGGQYRKWYGNRYYVVLWEDNGKEIKNCPKSAVRSPQYFFRPHISWTLISTGSFAARYFESGFALDTASNCIYFKNSVEYEVLGFLNSKVADAYLSVLNPTMNFSCGIIGLLPYTCEEDEVLRSLVIDSIEIEKSEFDNFENSWDFKKHPLVGGESLIENEFMRWEQYCNERHRRLQSNEEKINEYFIGKYNLANEMVSDVKSEDVTIRLADFNRDIKSLISYAVGCMFGRYSADKEGLIYAGGLFNPDNYSGYLPDEDGIIPINDEEYFEDDIVSKFVKFIAYVYGEDSLERNLSYIAQALKNKGNTSREIIRNYFLNDFFKDHCACYSVTGSGKRPIYWMFDSGKENGFKCLIYIHRYHSDTVGKIRIDYLHKTQRAIEQAMHSAEYIRDNATNGTEKSGATKRITKYAKQLAELKQYDEAVSHIANQRIDLDLNDGVKFNYAKFQGVEVAQEGKKALKIDLLAKI